MVFWIEKSVSAGLFFLFAMKNPSVIIREIYDATEEWENKKIILKIQKYLAPPIGFKINIEFFSTFTNYEA